MLWLLCCFFVGCGGDVIGYGVFCVVEGVGGGIYFVGGDDIDDDLSGDFGVVLDFVDFVVVF